MGLSCGKQTFEVDKSMEYSSQGDGFYRTYDHLNYWNKAKNGNTRAESDNGTEGRSVASTVAANGHGKSKRSSVNEAEAKSSRLDDIEELVI